MPPVSAEGDTKLVESGLVGFELTSDDELIRKFGLEVCTSTDRRELEGRQAFTLDLVSRGRIIVGGCL
jgi:hypothetical protein